MDTINTIGYNINMTDKTLIRREHKDRFKISGASAYGVIDRTIEGFTPILYKDSEKLLNYSKASSNFKWYLVV